jgi:hypothetical protein
LVSISVESNDQQIDIYENISVYLKILCMSIQLHAHTHN